MYDESGFFHDLHPMFVSLCDHDPWIPIELLPIEFARISCTKTWNCWFSRNIRKLRIARREVDGSYWELSKFYRDKEFKCVFVVLDWILDFGSESKKESTSNFYDLFTRIRREEWIVQSELVVYIGIRNVFGTISHEFRLIRREWKKERTSLKNSTMVRIFHIY